MNKLTKIFLAITGTGIAMAAGADLTKNEVSLAKVQAKYATAPQEVKQKYSLEGASFNAMEKDDPKDRVVMKIGNENGDFEPKIEIERWDDEVSFSVKPKAVDSVATKDKDLSFEGDKIKLATPKIDYKMYDLPATDENSLRGFEFEVDLKEKPKTNVIEFTLESKGLDFYHQPALTQAEIDEGVSRDNANSWVIYASDKKNYEGGKLYRAGKVGTIYEPIISDSSGMEVRGKLNIVPTASLLTVTIPQEFLDIAVYPVRNAAGLTFGYYNGGTPGGSSAGTTNSTGCKFTGAAGNITKITPYGKGTSATVTMYAALYSDNAGAPNALLTSETAGVSVDTTAGWDDIAVNAYTMSATDYWLWHGARTASQTLYWDAGAANQYNVQGVTGAWPNPLTPGTYNSRIISIYATYTAAASEETEGVLIE